MRGKGDDNKRGQPQQQQQRRTTMNNDGQSPTRDNKTGDRDMRAKGMMGRWGKDRWIVSASSNGHNTRGIFFSSFE
jgi:hypothetical protein